MVRYLFTIFLLTITVSFSRNFVVSQRSNLPPGFSSVDGFLFPGSVNSNKPTGGLFRPQGFKEDPERVTSPPINRNPPNFQQCFNNCPVRQEQTTSQFNPICGTNGVDYDNEGKLRCAQYCGEIAVQMSYSGRCRPLLPSVG